MTPADDLRALMLDHARTLRELADQLEKAAYGRRSDHTERDLGKAVEYLNRDG